MWILVLFYFHCLLCEYEATYLFISLIVDHSDCFFCLFFFAFPYCFYSWTMLLCLFFFTCFLIQISKNSCGLDTELRSYRICTFTVLRDNAKLPSKDLLPVDTSKNKESSCLHILDKRLCCQTWKLFPLLLGIKWSPWWSSEIWTFAMQRICLAMQGTLVPSLVQKEPTFHGAAKLRSGNSSVCLEPVLCNKRSRRNEKPVHLN